MTAAGTPARRLDRRQLVTAIARFREAGILIVLVLLMAFTAIRSGNFLTGSNLEGIGLDITKSVSQVHGVDAGASFESRRCFIWPI